MASWQIAIETSAIQSSAALFLADMSIATAVIEPGKARTQALFCDLERLLQRWRREEEPMAFISVGIGPGSFTGLRVGITAAKALAYALHCPVVPVDSLAAIALQMREAKPDALCWDVAVEAYRGQVFWRRESKCKDSVGSAVTVPTCVVDYAEWLSSFEALVGSDSSSSHTHGAMPCFGGDVWNRGIDPKLSFFSGPADTWIPRAEAVAKLALNAWEEGLSVPPMELIPNYLRASAAEEKLKLKESSND